MIDFDNITEEQLPHMLGGTGCVERRMYLDEKNKIMRLTLHKGDRIGMHTHSDNSEICFILTGTATCYLDDTTEVVPAGCCHYCPQGHSHSVGNDHDEPMTMIAIVPNHFLTK